MTDITFVKNAGEPIDLGVKDAKQDDVITYNFRKECRMSEPGLYGKDIWQILFKLYRDAGGVIDGMHGMHDLLCDHDWLVRNFEKYKDWREYWHFDPKTGMTVVNLYTDSWYDHIYKIEYNQEQSEVTITKCNEFASDGVRP